VLTEALQFRVDHDWFVGYIKQHRAMAGRQDETIAVRPACGGGATTERPCITASPMFFFMSRFNVLGRKNDFTATYALLSRRWTITLAISI
jgi:hypothetical protein